MENGKKEKKNPPPYFLKIEAKINLKKLKTIQMKN